ncbi:hypothetical protein [Bosea sp. (in: a-proteobacteria)]|jgi:hypothetical protein|uniref:hypothetical protein n=1 Tax=Bosea sp. (in: a-proteobacteria) TaxID=1871050 RepID=UPI002DDD8379|nr:hypothetical protein [Bosea sp. (in: a-proteobacteria)]HEV2508641.1 hypothetical protein [Bosea sp. (in: a-proteobacteria)]
MKAADSVLRFADSSIAVDQDPSQQEEIEAIATMVAYLIPQARTLSPGLVLLLNLALHELSLLRALQDGSVIRLHA